MINYYDELNNLQCYQEYFQGPCEEGQQLTTIENELEIPEPICVPKNCSENQIDYNSTCVDIVTCGDNEVMQFNQEKQFTECIFEFAIRSSLEVAIECRTEEGYHLSPSGDCVLAVTGGINRSPRSPTAGRQRNYKALLKSILNRRRNGREN